ncbi:NAD(P)/FAD-dependent oxidoreductase [Noviherbaspirillum soli]|uniref:NAD(P)/FAD-dependent oxidoreductase n=1 Tax=Noviherbaspirillum soli TaxID=1064518 RepID=UPI00188A8612|nr:NAD(P)/FAD-dependent oxidoreductase [Noviherbaspirillum soli]
MDKTDVIVIGAGVVGLAVARALAQAGREVMVVESHPAIGMETSSRNSEVIHAGLYYPSGSLKAALCVTGRDALYDYCAERGIAHQRCGKLVVATTAAQHQRLAEIAAQAHANGCTEVRMISADEARAMEPALQCTAALHSPMTGVIDSHGYMLALQGDAEHAGAVFAFASQVLSGERRDDGIVLRVAETGAGSDDEGFLLHARTVVNCAGLWAPRIARSIAGLDEGSIPRAWFAKGNYYSLAGRAPFSRLIYPVPEPGGLGVHLTLDLGGQARFGPDVEWLEDEQIDYLVDPARADRFYAEIRAYWPALPSHSLQPAYAGIRPKISPPGAPAADFLFASHGSGHYLGLYGIESPGLTASLAIADHVLGLTQALS